MPDFFPGSGRLYWQSEASAGQLVSPQAAVTADHTENSVRTLSLRITSPRRAPVIAIYTAPDTEVIDAAVDGNRAFRESAGPPMKNWGLQFYALPVEGIEVTLKLHDGKPFKMLLVDRSYGLPETKQRPENMIPTPYGVSDVTLVSRSFSF